MKSTSLRLPKGGADLILQAAYQQVQAQAPSATSSKGDIWLYVLPVPDHMRQLQDAEASAQPPFRETPAHHQHQQQRFAHRSSDLHVDASSPQGPLHRLSVDMSTSYQSPRSHSDQHPTCLVGCGQAMPL